VSGAVLTHPSDLRFTPRNAILVQCGLKLATTRRSAHGSVGDEFELGGTRFYIRAIIETTLWRVAEEAYLLEGEPSPGYFLDEWCRCYGTTVDQVDVHQRVFLHVFSAIYPFVPALGGRRA
jgi:hypothetical protein